MRSPDSESQFISQTQSRLLFISFPWFEMLEILLLEATLANSTSHADRDGGWSVSRSSHAGQLLSISSDVSCWFHQDSTAPLLHQGPLWRLLYLQVPQIKHSIYRYALFINTQNKTRYSSCIWKSLVASCVCVCGWSLNVRFQRVHLQRETRSSPAPSVRLLPAQNAFVGSDKRICLQWQYYYMDGDSNTFACNVISYSEVNSRGYVVAIDKRVCLQCDVVFGGE